jgi:hypothetical protein
MQIQWKPLLIGGALVLGLAAPVFAIDRDDNPPGPAGGPGTNWANPPGPRGGPGACPNRHLHQHYLQHARYCDRAGNPPGPAGGPGTNWANPPGPRGGPGACPNRRQAGV